MAAKVPAIVGNYSCIPEVTDGGAFLINSSNASSAAQLINEYLTNTDQVQEFIKKGYEVVSGYSWETTVEQTWNEIKQLV
jgi:glycosyltransferase involved in cell wall biosynthesis